LNSVVDKPVDESDGALRNSARWPCVEGNPEVAEANDDAILDARDRA
jgi:hypothetical protein